MKYFLKKGLIALLLIACLPAMAQRNSQNQKTNATVNALVDLSHAFTFYADGRFATQYLGGQNSAMCWGNLYDFDFKNTNLLVLISCEDKAPYTSKDIETIKTYVKNGGGLVVLGNPSLKSQGELASIFGATFAATTKEQLKAVTNSEVVESQGQATILKFKSPKQWKIHVKDAKGEPVLASSVYGKGNVLIGSRSIAGSNPNAKDSINVNLWKPLLLDIAKSKKVDTQVRYEGRAWNNLGNKETKQGLTVSYNDYLAPYANAMFDITARCMPVIEKRMGVPLSEGMASSIMLLATDGGGFSSGATIGLAVWWGGFPEKEDSMIEFITHESVHSWVLPFPEVWNEPIATYVGNLVMIDMGYKEEAEKRIADCIKRVVEADPNFDLYDLDGKSNKAGVADLPENKVNNLHWGKSYWIWEQMRAENPTIVADYFKAKRKHATPDKIKKYDMNNTVAIMSIAMGRDLFPWFQSKGFKVERATAEIKF